jgi:hypothetical protein
MKGKKILLSQCLSCKRVQSRDGDWYHLDEESTDMVLKQVLCPDCSKTKKSQGELAENLTGEIMDVLVKTPGGEFDCMRALTPIQLAKYKTVVKGTIMLYLQQNEGGVR